ncbi:MAG: hypothetical protein C3F07_18280 [Anaerolineales bacterium]|nr:hypothetical protein [Anaerolineae bacterium]PWB69890.1 MAG: hypothetical protein C3F07_18280 [Anaerolineales bacterium]
MKKTSETKTRKVKEMAAEYRFDYRKAKPNRFAKKMETEPLVVMIEPDIARVFKTSEQVNKALRALISAMPEKETRSLAK